MGDLSKINLGSYQQNTRIPTRSDPPRKRHNYEANPDCQTCGGIGWVHPGEYGEIIPCEAPGCLKEQHAVWLGSNKHAEARGVFQTKVGEEKTFKNFTRTPGNRYTTEDGEIDIRGELERMAAGKTNYVFALLYGPTGNGKSHLCTAFARAILKRQASCSMWVAAELVAKLRQGIDDKTTEQTMGECKNTYAFVLDDLKLDQLSERAWGLDKIEEILSYRYQAQLVTLVTTNCDIMTFPERLISRFQDTRISKMLLNKDYDHRGVNK